MANLYEIERNYQEVLDKASHYAAENDGEVSSELADMLETEFEVLSDKMESVALYTKNEVAVEKAIADEIKILQQRKKTHTNKIKWLKSYLSTFVDDKFETARVKVSFRRSESVSILDNADIPDDLCDVKVAPNKTRIKGFIKAGGEIDGVELIENRNIQIK